MRYSLLSLSLLVATFVAFLGTAVGASQSLGELLARDAQRSQALHTQAELQRLLMLLVDIETGQRGFIITGQQPFLRPYEDAVGELSDLRAGLRVRLPLQGVDVKAFSRLDGLVDERLAQARQAIARRLADGGAMMRDLSAYVDGKRVMDELRFQIEQLAREQQRRIADADEATQVVSLRTSRLTRLLPGVGLVTLAVAAALLLREHRLRDRAEAALRDANAGLERQVGQRTQDLSLALARIRSFAVEMDRGIETERRRLAREVHDQVGQVGTAIKMLTLSLRAKLAPRSEPLVDELQELSEEAIRAARHISAELHPPLLDELGLEAALDHHLKALQRHAPIVAKLDLCNADTLSAEQAGPLFRIVQEACTNVLRHAQASTLKVVGRPSTDRGVPGYELDVVDDGRGPGSVRPDAAGLRNMRERAELAGGHFEFGPAPERGARVRVWLPLLTSPATAPPFRETQV